MGMKIYKATGAMVTLASKLLGLRLRVTGTEHLTDQPTMFVVNHFTRFETFLVPYALYQQTGRPVHSLATHTLFKGWFARYLNSVGVMSTRHPKRNRIIIGELLSGISSWVIYPEGGLVKNKKTVRKGRLEIVRPDRTGPPHTGAALMALKAEMCRRRYLRACEKNDAQRRNYYEERFGLAGPEEITRTPTLIIPVSITYHSMRPGGNAILRLAKWLNKDLNPTIEEELQIEGRILLGNSEINIHFSEPIEVADYLDRGTRLVRRIMGIFSDSEARRNALLMGRQARRLTGEAMRSIYNSIEINVEHLFCYGLRMLKRDTVPVIDFHKALYIAAVELRDCEEIRLHSTLQNGLTAMSVGRPYAPLDEIINLARKEGVVRVAQGQYHIDRNALDENYDFHDIRLKRMVQVVANELEPIQPATTIVRRSVNLPSRKLNARVATALHEIDQSRFSNAYSLWSEEGVSKPYEYGEPFFLKAPTNSVGVVLTHGYLASPEQIRPLANYLHDRGWSVYGVRLSGHGTAPQHLGAITWQDWLKSVIRGYGVVRQHCDQVVLGGFSLGGVLALLTAAEQLESVRGVFAINTPFTLRDKRAHFVTPLIYWHGLMRMLHLMKRPGMVDNSSESPLINYQTDTLHSVRELRRAMKACRQRLGQVTTPAYLIQATNDPVVTADSGRHILDRVSSSMKGLAEPDFDRHVIIRDAGCGEVFDKIGAFVQRVTQMESEGVTRVSVGGTPTTRASA